MHVYMASICSSSSGPLMKCKRHSTHFTNCCVSLRQHCNAHSHIHWTGMILWYWPQNTTADALHLRTSECPLSGFLTVSGWWRPDKLVMSQICWFFFSPQSKFFSDKQLVCFCLKIGQHWKTRIISLSYLVNENWFWNKCDTHVNKITNKLKNSWKKNAVIKW